jgi:hypothetical protein
MREARPNARHALDLEGDILLSSRDAIGSTLNGNERHFRMKEVRALFFVCTWHAFLKLTIGTTQASPKL